MLKCSPSTWPAGCRTLAFPPERRRRAPSSAPYVIAVTSAVGRLGLRTLNLRGDFQIQAFYRYLSANFTIIIQILLSQKLNRFLEISKRPVINILAEYVDNYRVICILYLLNLLLAAPVHTSLPSRRDETNLLRCAFQ